MSTKYEKEEKGVWRMPRLPQAMKDVISCEKLRGGANNLRSADVRMGKPGGENLRQRNMNP